MRQPNPEEQKSRIRGVYNAAADHFDDPALNFWSHCGLRTVELAGIGTGEVVLDVCCGTGASAIPAAEKVGDTGRVTGVDFAQNLLEIARAKAQMRGFSNLDFVQGDMTALEFPNDSFDAVVCVFGIFFAPDMPAALAGLWSKVRPGGRLALTVWGPRVLEPLSEVFWGAVEELRPDLKPKVVLWERLKQPEGLAALFEEAGLPEPRIVPDTLISPVSSEQLWTVVLGTGMRGPIDQMEPGEADGLRRTVLQRFEANNTGSLTSDFLYARLVRR